MPLTNCCYCGTEIEKTLGNINRSLRRGMMLFCDQMCFGLYHRAWKTESQNKAHKSEYDAKYRAVNQKVVKKKKAEYFKKDYDANPEKYKAIRQTRMAAHVEYCRDPEYRKKKVKYDAEYRAKKIYGEFWESALLLFELDKELPDKSITRIEKGLDNKTQKRKRLWKNLQQSV